jgi:hypothetical protein
MTLKSVGELVSGGKTDDVVIEVNVLKALIDAVRENEIQVD